MTFDVESGPRLGELAALLSAAFRSPVEVSVVERAGPWAVARCRLAGLPPSLPSSVIVKWLREDPNNFRTDPAQLLTERAALSFVAALGVDVAPRLIAGHPTDEMLVMEDLAPREALLDLLVRRDPAAPAGMLAFARATGELHAATTGLAAAYYTGRRALGPVDPKRERGRFLGGRANETRATFEELGVVMSVAAADDVGTLVATLAEPGPFLAFSNGDSGPNNFLVKGEDGRVIDFEFAGYRHALTDVACLRVPGPAWLTVGDAAGDGSEAEYRRTLSRVIAEAEDDALFGLGMAAGCLGMAIERLSRFWKLDARRPGDDSRLQLVSTLEAACRAAEHHRSLLELSGWVQRVIELLRRRWPDANVDLSQYEPFTPRSSR